MNSFELTYIESHNNFINLKPAYLKFSKTDYLVEQIFIRLIIRLIKNKKDKEYIINYFINKHRPGNIDKYYIILDAIYDYKFAYNYSKELKKELSPESLKKVKNYINYELIKKNKYQIYVKKGDKYKINFEDKDYTFKTLKEIKKITFKVIDKTNKGKFYILFNDDKRAYFNTRREIIKATNKI